MINHFEKPDKEKLAKAIIHLYLFRHSAKEEQGNKSDENVLINEEGKRLALSKFDETKQNVVGYYTARKRSEQTIAYMAFGSELDDTEEMEKEINIDPKSGLELKYAKRFILDDQLDFKNGHKTEYNKRMRDEFYQGTFLKFLVEESDQYAKSINDVGGATYSRMAGQIAQIVEKYLVAINNWSQILENNPAKYDSNELNRFLCTHQGLGESFLAKVIEKTDGLVERDKFVKALHNTGFDFTEGLTLDIEKTNNETLIHVSFNKVDQETGELVYAFEKNISKELLEEIIREGRA